MADVAAAEQVPCFLTICALMNALQLSGALFTCDITLAPRVVWSLVDSFTYL